ncbi:GIY-YIG nuclease family protein [Cohnella sp. GCM10027633]|uniref:GIY-YIG nuclease family protein n=1 Tax=unclassified Cohnella TaxID=2636738 RepID=UPI003638217B
MLDKQKKKELSAAYAQSPRAMGIYQIRNTENGKVLVDGTLDLEGARNRFAFSRQTNMNSVFEYKDDWQTFGSSAFVFEELDRIAPREELAGDPNERKIYKQDVDALLELWLDKLQPYGDKGYNKLKRT